MRKVYSLIILAAVIAIASVSSASCSTAQHVPTGQTVCVASESDGSITLRVWGSGRNILDAKEQAKKNAVEEVIFNGIRQGNSSYTQTPLVVEANARTKYEQFFNHFFTDGGEYSKFVTMEDRRVGSRAVNRGRNQVSTCITVRVLRPQLKEALRAEGIIY